MNTFTELRESGLLWWINSRALHPHGLALGLQFDDQGEAIGYKIYVSEDGFWEFTPEDEQAGKEKFDSYLQSLKDAGSIDLNKKAS